jgi:hypothetical protein
MVSMAPELSVGRFRAFIQAADNATADVAVAEIFAGWKARQGQAETIRVSWCDDKKGIYRFSTYRAAEAPPAELEEQFPNDKLVIDGERMMVETVDFAPHTLEHLREEHAHRHLGVSELDFARWADRAGFTVTKARTFHSPAREKGVAVTIWTADAADARQSGRSAA